MSFRFVPIHTRQPVQHLVMKRLDKNLPLIAGTPSRLCRARALSCVSTLSVVGGSVGGDSASCLIRDANGSEHSNLELHMSYRLKCERPHNTLGVDNGSNASNACNRGRPHILSSIAGKSDRTSLASCLGHYGSGSSDLPDLTGIKSRMMQECFGRLI